MRWALNFLPARTILWFRDSFLILLGIGAGSALFPARLPLLRGAAPAVWQSPCVSAVLSAASLGGCSACDRSSESPPSVSQELSVLLGDSLTCSERIFFS